VNRGTVLQGVLVLLAVIAGSELAFSNLFTLLTSVESTAADFGLTPGAERIRLGILIVLDAVAGGGAVTALVGYRRSDTDLFTRGLYLTLAGFVCYGVYQVASAQLQLAATYSTPVSVAGVTYAAFGVAAFAFGRQFVENGNLQKPES
jgi:hypothetical protein